MANFQPGILNKVVPKSRGKILHDSVSMFLDGKAFNGWEAVSITKNLGSIANAFSFSTHDKFQIDKLPFPFKPGVKVDINIADERVITGRIEKITLTYGPTNRSYRIVGRTLVGDLIDSSVTGPTEYTNIKLDELARNFLKPFGLQVFLSVVPQVIEKFSVKPGETIFNALDRAARLQGFMWVSTREGNLRLTRAARARATSELHQDVNIKSAEIVFDDTQRFSEYNVIGQMSAADNAFGEVVTQPQGTAKDEGIGRFRPKTIIAESSIDSAKAKTRAGWEASVRIARSMRMSIETQGWRQEDGSLWGINQITKVVSKFLGVNGDFLVESVTHSQDNSVGTITNLGLVRTDAYQSKPTFNKNDDPLSFLGAVDRRSPT